MRKEANKKKSLNAVRNLPIFASLHINMSPPDAFFCCGSVLQKKYLLET